VSALSATTPGRAQVKRAGIWLGAVLSTTLLLLIVGAVAGRVRPAAPDSSPAGGVVAQPAVVSNGANVPASIAVLQTRLRTLPNDWSAWASLGALYTAQARLSADPSYYGKADGAFVTSLRIRPNGNPAALTGQATLAASRHDFAGALALTERAAGLDPYGSTNLGVTVDALIELGRYPQAFTTLQRMVDLKPGVASFTRVSYSYELRGDLTGARYGLQRALEVAQSPGDRAFALQYLGELAYNNGDLTTAAREFSTGLRLDPAWVPLLAGRARVEAARGDTAAALRDWADVTARLPQPTYLIEYADLLTSLGRTRQARTQYAVVDATAKLFRAQRANVDVELSLFHADHGHPAQAMAEAGAQIKQRDSITVDDAYAWALHGAGRDRDALRYAKAANRLGMKNALFAYHRGVIEQALGHRAAAVTWYARSLQINPFFSPLLAPKAKAALTTLHGRP